jgi:3-oxoacyl-[acyl-carrier-protein] synthase II
MNTGEAATRTVVSGVGVVSPIGIGNPAFWNSLMEGRSGVGIPRAFSSRNLPTHFTAEVLDFDPLVYLPQRKFLKVMSRAIQLGVAAANLAMSDARLRVGDVDPDRLGVVYGAGRISTMPEELADAVRTFGEEEIPFNAHPWGEEDMSKIAPLWLLRQLPNMPACHVSLEFDARGPNNTITSRDSSALLALMEAVNVIERGAADCMIVGGCGSNVQPVDLAKFCLYEELSPRDTHPEQACRPFDWERDGTIAGEGAAAFVVESLPHAVQRGAEIHAEILGIGAGCDGSGSTNAENGTGLVNAIQSALQKAHLKPAQLGHVNAQGKSTQREDVIEARAYHLALGEAAPRVPVTALKSYFGYSDAGSGAMELAGSLLAIKHGRIPATLNYQTPDPRCRLNIIHEGPMEPLLPTAMSVNRTSLGQSAAVVLRRL